MCKACGMFLTGLGRVCRPTRLKLVVFVMEQWELLAIWKRHCSLRSCGGRWTCVHVRERKRQRARCLTRHCVLWYCRDSKVLSIGWISTCERLCGVLAGRAQEGLIRRCVSSSSQVWSPKASFTSSLACPCTSSPASATLEVWLAPHELGRSLRTDGGDLPQVS